jgi:methyl-accepting chemotaxis protein
MEFLRRWHGLSGVQRRALDALIREIEIASGDVEANVHGLSERLKSIAGTAREQAATVQDLVASIQAVRLDHEAIPLPEVAASLGDALSGLVNKITVLSSRGASMSTALDGVLGELKSVEASVAQIDKINKQTNLLGSMPRSRRRAPAKRGADFSVVADEVRELAKTVNELSALIRGQISSMSSGLHASHGLLREIAAVERSDESVDTNARIKTIMRCLVEQNARYAGVLQQTAETTERINRDVSAAVVGMQFQDLAKQRLENVNAAIAAVGRVISELRDKSTPAAGSDRIDDRSDQEWIERMLAQCTLSEVRNRLAAQIQGKAAPASTSAPAKPAASVADDGVEFF